MVNSSQQGKFDTAVDLMLVPPAPYRLLPMGLDDIGPVIGISRASFPTPTGESLLRYELTQNALANYQVLLAGGDAAEPIIGYGGYWTIADEMHVSTIAVSPDWRGRGLGELLLLNMLFMANQQAAQTATLEVRQHNRVAQALYRKYAFAVVGLRRRYYHDTGDDAVLMSVSPLDAAYFQYLEKNRVNLFARLVSEA